MLAWVLLVVVCLQSFAQSENKLIPSSSQPLSVELVRRTSLV